MQSSAYQAVLYYNIACVAYIIMVSVCVHNLCVCLCACLCVHTGLAEFNNIALFIPEVEMVEDLTFSWNEESTFDRRKGHGFVLHVPKGAVSSSNCTVQVKSFVVSQSTPEFTFPEGLELVSGVYHIDASKELSKPVSLQFQHCAVIKDDSQVEVVIADSTTGPPYHFKSYTGGRVCVFESYIKVELAHFSFLSCIFRAFSKRTSIRYCGLICCLRSSVVTWEYHIVLVRNLQRCIAVSELLHL